MCAQKRKPLHPGTILDEDYIKPLGLKLQDLADHLGIARNTLFKLRMGKARITTSLAMSLAAAFETTPELWLNLQQKYDIWCEENKKTKRKKVIPIYRARRKRIISSSISSSNR